MLLLFTGNLTGSPQTLCNKQAGEWQTHNLYTCQLFLRYKHEIFILGVLGFLKTTR